GLIFVVLSKNPTVNSFSDCVKADNNVLQSEPRVCFHKGKKFIELPDTNQEIPTKKPTMKQFSNPPPLTLDTIEKVTIEEK
ncbi:hypothetical protein HYS11_00210, partial [Candidatus Gottesmanbacteria bacterium]|nr:hypothetical protein [Candidatus Gottesmanbacteria bacterium]